MTFEKIREIIMEQLSVDENAVTMETHLMKDLEADSLDAVEIIMAIEDEFEIEQMVSFASLSEEGRRSDTMKDKDEQTALIGMAIGAAVISLVATQKQINQGSIVDELVRLGRQKGDGVEDEVFVQAARLVSKGT